MLTGYCVLVVPNVWILQGLEAWEAIVMSQCAWRNPKSMAMVNGMKALKGDPWNNLNTQKTTVKKSYGKKET